MGNNCVGPSSGVPNFFQSLSAALSRSREPLPDPALPPPNNAAALEPAPAHQPPEPIKIPEDETPPPPALPPQAATEEESKKPNAVKRVRSAGLQMDSILRRRTGRLKEVYSIGRKLGQGQFGTTYLCIEKSTGKEFACKSIAKRKLLTPEDVEDVRREIQILHHLAGHPNVISIVGAYEDVVAVHVVMEMCAGGELFDRIIARGHYTEKAAAELARVIVGVMEACHSLGVMHRDLKPENFLFVNQTESSPLKMIDFGLSIFFKPGDIFTDVVGSPYYVAPEVLQKHYGQESDVWSAGVMIYILLSGVPPFWDGNSPFFYFCKLNVITVASHLSTHVEPTKFVRT